MDDTALGHYVKSMRLNVDTMYFTECISKGVDVGQRVPRDDNGWHRVGRYCAGKPSARVQAHKIRQRWPNIETNIRGVDNEEWKAEIWVRVKAA